MFNPLILIFSILTLFPKLGDSRGLPDIILGPLMFGVILLFLFALGFFLYFLFTEIIFAILASFFALLQLISDLYISKEEF